MKRITTAVALLALSAGVSRAADEPQQAFLGIFAETSVMKMAGMKMPAMPKLPPGIKLPPQAQQALAQFAPQRKLSVRLWSPGIAPDNATASLAVPDGLKQGPKLDLDLYRPKSETGSDEDTAPAGSPGAIDTEMSIKQYWGSSATVRPGQPEVVEFKGLSAEQQAAMRKETAKARQGATYFYKPNWTTGYWPTGKQPGTIDPDAVLEGHYALTSSYTGNVAIDVPAKVNLLEPIEMTSPPLEEKVPLEKAIRFRWKAVPNALGYHATIFGMIQSTKTIIMWDSSEIKPRMGFITDYLQMSEVADFVKQTMFMAGDTVEVTVPEAIFKDCDIVSMQMIGWGPGTALDKGQPIPRVQTKTTLTLMLGGKMMNGRRGFGN
ncbi:MAG: hypothetical protein JWL77_184 [Chthonomonadaceae bacterium]|nr:hypothetical protein [Chthonomonadaceae bacterium]